MDDESPTEILDATYRALCERGYAELTVREIAAEADVSKAAIHYHYGSKDRLFAAFLDYLYDRHTERLRSLDGSTPPDRLDSLFEALLTDDESASRRGFRTVMLEVKAQAPYDAAVRRRLAEFDGFLFERIRSVLAEGVAGGSFDERVDPALAAEFLTTAIEGAQTRQVAVDHPPDRLYAAVTRYAERHLLADGSTEVAR